MPIDISTQTDKKTSYGLPKPVPAYMPTDEKSPLFADRKFYDRVADTEEKGERKLVEKFVVPIRSLSVEDISIGEIKVRTEYARELLLFIMQPAVKVPPSPKWETCGE